MSDTVKIEYTNFEGDWEAACEYCGQPQRQHQIDVGELEGTKYVHRMPCEQEKYEIKKRAAKQGATLRTVLLFINVGKYIWGKVPFKEEVKLVLGAIKHIYISIRAFFYLKTQKPK